MKQCNNRVPRLYFSHSLPPHGRGSGLTGLLSRLVGLSPECRLVAIFLRDKRSEAFRSDIIHDQDKMSMKMTESGGRPKCKK